MVGQLINCLGTSHLIIDWLNLNGSTHSTASGREQVDLADVGRRQF